MSNNKQASEEKTPTTGKRIKEAILPSGPKSVAEPEKELRFSRSLQATQFFIIAAILFGAGVTFIATSIAPEAPKLIWIWSIPLFILTFVFFRSAIYCARHAYIILTPLGVEIFPFFKARENLQVVYWTQIVDIEVDQKCTLLTLHFNIKQTSGIKISLKPVAKEQRSLLENAMKNTMKNKEKSKNKE